MFVCYLVRVLFCVSSFVRALSCVCFCFLMFLCVCVCVLLCVHFFVCCRSCRDWCVCVFYVLFANVYVDTDANAYTNNTTIADADNNSTPLSLCVSVFLYVCFYMYACVLLFSFCFLCVLFFLDVLAAVCFSSYVFRVCVFMC